MFIPYTHAHTHIFKEEKTSEHTARICKDDGIKLMMGFCANNKTRHFNLAQRRVAVCYNLRVYHFVSAPSVLEFFL